MNPWHAHPFLVVKNAAPPSRWEYEAQKLGSPSAAAAAAKRRSSVKTAAFSRMIEREAAVQARIAAHTQAHADAQAALLRTPRLWAPPSLPPIGAVASAHVAFTSDDWSSIQSGIDASRREHEQAAAVEAFVAARVAAREAIVPAAGGSSPRMGELMAVVRIQRWCRRLRRLHRQMRLLLGHDTDLAVSIIQRAWLRACLPRYRRSPRRLHTRTAQCIQRWYRNKRARMWQQTRRATVAIIQLQARFRARRERRHVYEMRFVHAFRTHATTAAIRIQAMWRGNRIRTQYRVQLLLSLAALQVQRVWRGHVARMRLREKAERELMGPLDRIDASLRAATQTHDTYRRRVEAGMRIQASIDRDAYRVGTLHRDMARLNAVRKRLDEQEASLQRVSGACVSHARVSSCRRVQLLAWRREMMGSEQALKRVALALKAVIQSSEWSGKHFTCIPRAAADACFKGIAAAAALTGPERASCAAHMADLLSKLTGKVHARSKLESMVSWLAMEMSLEYAKRTPDVASVHAQREAVDEQVAALSARIQALQDAIADKRRSLGVESRRIGHAEHHVVDAFTAVQHAAQHVQEGAMRRQLVTVPAIVRPIGRAVPLTISNAPAAEVTAMQQIMRGALLPFLASSTGVRAARVANVRAITAEVGDEAAMQLVGPLAPGGWLAEDLLPVNERVDLHALTKKPPPEIDHAIIRKSALRSLRTIIPLDVSAKQRRDAIQQLEGMLKKRKVSMSRVLSTLVASGLAKPSVRAAVLNTRGNASSDTESLQPLASSRDSATDAAAVASLTDDTKPLTSARVHVGMLLEDGIASQTLRETALGVAPMTLALRPLQPAPVMTMSHTAAERPPLQLLDTAVPPRAISTAEAVAMSRRPTTASLPALAAWSRHHTSDAAIPDRIDSPLKKHIGTLMSQARATGLTAEDALLPRAPDTYDGEDDPRVLALVGPEERARVRAEEAARAALQRDRPRDVLNFTIQDVCAWVISIGHMRYAMHFSRARVDGEHLMVLDSETINKVVGVSDVLHASEILRDRDALLETSVARLLTYRGEQGGRIRSGSPPAGPARPVVSPRMRPRSHVKARMTFARARAGQLHVVATALEEGMDVDDEDPDTGDSLLITASKYGHVRLLDLVLARGANLNHQNARGNTALHFVCDRRWRPSADATGRIRATLVAHGASRDIRNAVGLTCEEGAGPDEAPG